MTHSQHCTFNRTNFASYFEVSSLIMASQQTAEGQQAEGEVCPRTGHEGPEGEERYSFIFFFNLGARLGWVVNVTPRLLYPRYPWNRRPDGPQGPYGRVRKGSFGWTVHYIMKSQQSHHGITANWSRSIGWTLHFIMKSQESDHSTPENLWRSIGWTVPYIMKSQESDHGNPENLWRSIGWNLHYIMKSQQSDHGFIANWSRSFGWTEESAVWSWDHCKFVKIVWSSNARYLSI
jgi:hypothetical protein